MTKAKAARRRFQLRIDLFKGGAGGLGNEREGDNGGSDYRALPSKDEVDAMCIQPAAKRAVTPEEDEQV